MALVIQNYLQPGRYSQVIPNPTATTTTAPPIVAVLGQALQGPYSPQLFTDPSLAQSTYGIATKANPLSLGMQIAFNNGASNVIGLNVQPDNSTPTQVFLNVTAFSGAPYLPAPSSALDAVTGQPINSTGNVAGTFYIQDFNPIVPDPYLNSTPQATQQAYANAGPKSMLQYVQLTSPTFVPTANSSAVQIVVYSAATSSPPASSITQVQWNSFQNAQAIANGINGAYGSPAYAQLLLLDNGTTNPPSYGSTTNYTDFYEVIALANQTNGYLINSTGGTPTQLGGPNSANPVADVYKYAFAAHGNAVLNILALQVSNQHQIVMGLFDSNSSSVSSATNGFGLGIPGIVSANGPDNPYLQFANGTNGVITTNSFINALAQLETVRADIIVGLNTDAGFQSALKTHVTYMSSTNERNERIALVSGPISEQYQTTILNATALQGGPGARRMAYAWPTGGIYFDEYLNTTVTLDGTYLACALAGIAVSYDVATPLTHKVISGFQDVIYHFTNTGMNNIAQNGILVIENNPTYGLRVRDGITCDPTSAETQEISVVRQLDYTAQALRDTMDANVIATKITKSTIGVVQNLATTTLQALEDSNIIYGYKNVVARINPNDPRQIDLSVTVRPAYPCKYVQITISVTSALTGLS